MKKKLAVLGTIAVMGLIGFCYLQSGGTGAVSSTLSDRAREYLQGRKDSNDDSWKRVSLDGRDDGIYEAGTAVTIDDCFSMQVPFPMTEARREDACSYRIFLADPKGYIVAYRHSAAAQSLDDIPDVKMRRLYKDRYTEGVSDAGTIRFTTFRSAGIEYEKTAFYLRGGSIYVLSFIVPTNEDLDAQFSRMLASVRIIME